MKDSPIRNIYRAVTDVIYLCLLAFFSAVLGLFITAGASLKAAYNVMFKLHDQNRATYIFKEFKEAFMKDFLQVTLTWIMILLVGLGLFFSFNYATNTDHTVLLVIVYVALVELLLFMSYYFPIMSTFESPSYYQTIKNTILMMHGHISVSIRLIGTIIVILYLVLYVSSMFIFLGVPIYLYFNTFILQNTFQKYIDITRGEQDEIPEL